MNVLQVLAISETKNREDKPRECNEIPNFSIWNSERKGSDKGGGGLSIIYRKSLRHHRWSPTTPASKSYIEKERQWLLLEGSSEKLAFLNVYIACQNNRSNDYLQWNDDLFSLLTEETQILKEQGFSILALGDFNTRVGQIPGLENNTPDINKNYPMFINFIKSTDLVIMNALPVSQGLYTRFSDASNKPGTRSVLDYGLRDSTSLHTISSFKIDSDARFDCSSDHALLEATISFGSKTSVHWQVREALQFNFNANSSYDGFQKILEDTCSTISLNSFSSLTTEEMLVHLVTSVRESGIKSFGLKTKRNRKGS